MSNQAAVIPTEHARECQRGNALTAMEVPLVGIRIVDTLDAHWIEVLITAYCVCVFRALLEYYIYGQMPAFLFSVYGAHYPLSFLCFATTIALFVSLLTGYPIGRTCKVVLALMPIILLPPLIDACCYGLQARKIFYLPLAENPVTQFVDAVFRRTLHDYISVGQLFVVHAVALCCGYFSWRLTRKVGRSVLVWFSVLIVIYVYSALPSAVIEISRNANDVVRAMAMLDSLPHDGNLTGAISSYYEVEIAIYLLIVPVLILCIMLLHDKATTLSVMKNMRPGRLIHYVVLALLGIVAGIKSAGAWSGVTGAVTNPIAVLDLLEAVAAAFVGAVWINDLYDRQIDEISNCGRPIVSGAVSEKGSLLLATGSFGLAIACAWTLGYETLIWVLVVLALAWMYSAPPLRLRRRFPVSVLTIGAISWGVVQAGVSVVAKDHMLVPLPLGLGVLFGVPLIATFKDLKDVKGDKAARVTTLATWLPEPWARLATCAAILVGANVLAISLFDTWLALGFGIGGGTAVAAVVWYAPHRETVVFLMYHMLLAAGLILWTLH